MAGTNTLCTSGQAMIKAGVDINWISGAIVADQFVQEAEGVVCGIARYDLVTNYANINTVGKELLRQITSDLAGIKLIQYDMNDYSRIAAEDQINVLRDAALRGLGMIKDTKVLEFIGAK